MKLVLALCVLGVAAAGECFVQFHANGDDLVCNCPTATCSAHELKGGRREKMTWASASNPTAHFTSAEECHQRATAKFNYCKLNQKHDTKITVQADFVDNGATVTYTASNTHRAGECWIQRHGENNCPKCDEPGVTSCTNNNKDGATWKDSSVTTAEACLAKAKGIYTWCKTDTIKWWEGKYKGIPEPAISAHWYDGDGTMASDTQWSTRDGCHITMQTCPLKPNHPNCNGKWPCTFAEQWQKWKTAADTNEGACLKRAKAQLGYCGIDTSTYQMMKNGKVDEQGSTGDCDVTCKLEDGLIRVTHPNQDSVSPMHRCAIIDNFNGNVQITGSDCKCFCLESLD